MCLREEDRTVRNANNGTKQIIIVKMQIVTNYYYYTSLEKETIKWKKKIPTVIKPHHHELWWINWNGRELHTNASNRKCRIPSHWWFSVVRTSETQTADRMVPACLLPCFVCTVAVNSRLAGSGTQREEGAGPNDAAWTESKFKLLSLFSPFLFFYSATNWKDSSTLI